MRPHHYNDKEYYENIEDSTKGADHKNIRLENNETWHGWRTGHDVEVVDNLRE
jgi:hypothetical protein